MRLTDMSRLLEDLALEKIKGGDEAGAKAVLQVRGEGARGEARAEGGEQRSRPRRHVCQCRIGCDGWRARLGRRGRETHGWE